MGQEHSSSRKHASEASNYDLPTDGRVSLWEGVPPPILWLVQSQVKQLLQNHMSALLHRPEALEVMDDDDDDEEEGEEGGGGTQAAQAAQRPEQRRGPMQPHEAALAAVALRDKAVGPRLQKALDRLVPARMVESAFWDNFFSHVDVIKVRVVTDFLTAQDGVRAAERAKFEGWVQLFDAMEPEMRQDVRRAAERIAARQQPPPPSAVELALGLDAQRTPRWVPDSADASLEYVEDGPHEIAKVLRGMRAMGANHARALAWRVSMSARCFHVYTLLPLLILLPCSSRSSRLAGALVARGELADEPVRSPTAVAPGELPMWRSPDDLGRHKLDVARRGEAPRDGRPDALADLTDPSVSGENLEKRLGEGGGEVNGGEGGEGVAGQTAGGGDEEEDEDEGFVYESDGTKSSRLGRLTSPLTKGASLAAGAVGGVAARGKKRAAAAAAAVAAPPAAAPPAELALQVDVGIVQEGEELM